jgi:hypothetical protein
MGLLRKLLRRRSADDSEKNAATEQQRQRNRQSTPQPASQVQNSELFSSSARQSTFETESSSTRQSTIETVQSSAEPDIVSSLAEGKIRRAEERLGLLVLANQASNDLDAVDIVAIHGINGHRMKTWTTMSQSGQPVTWIKDFLPHHIPHARVMTFGYDSSVKSSKSVADVGTFANELLEGLLSRRQSSIEQMRPIIFVCHSLGGIVAKKAIIKAHEGERFENLSSSVRGIMFFGTPHRGSSVATWSTLLANTMSAARLGTATNKVLSRDLQTQSEVLQQISKSFVQRAKSLQLISFYETDKMDYMNCRVVEEDSAVLGFPNEVAIAMKGNHKTICRFGAVHDPRYRIVWTNLQSMSGSAAHESLLPLPIANTS